MKKFTFLLALYLLVSAHAIFAQKVVITGLNHITTDGFSFAARENLPVGEVIYFTENEYDNIQDKFVEKTESVVAFTVTSAISAGNVVFVKETASADFFTVTSSGGSGTAVKTAGSGPFAISTNGEGFYAYKDINDDDPTTGVTEIYSVLYTGSGEAPTQNGGLIPALQDPVPDFSNAIVIHGFPDDGNGSAGLDRVEYNPALRNVGVSTVNFTIIGNWLHSQLNADLSTTPFVAVADPSVSVSVSPSSVPEDGATNLIYTFTISSTATSNVTVNFSVGGTADFSSGDYSQTGAAIFGASFGSVVIANGSSTATITINPVTDPNLETNETVLLTISSGFGYIPGSPISATGTITNDDVNTTSPLVAFTGINHIDPDGFSFAALNNISDGTTVYFTENSFNNSTLAFTGDEAVLQWVASGSVVKGEVIYIKETSTNTPSVICGDGGACGTITRISGDFAHATSGETIYAYADADADHKDDITTIYSALYTGNSSVPGGNIPAAENPKTYYTNSILIDGFPAVDPNRTEYDPLKRVVDVSNSNFSNLNNWLHAQSSQDLSTVPFVESILPSVTVSISPSNVLEDGATGMVYTFTLSAVAASNYTINFTVGGTAELTTDYTQTGAATFGAISGTVLIPVGSSSAAITIIPVADSDLETNETVLLTVSPGSGYVSGSPSAQTGTISNDDTGISDPLVAITGLNHLDPDGFSFVAVKDIPASTKIYFTENSFDNTTLKFGSGESVISWTSPASIVPAGQVIVVTETGSDVFSVSRSGAAAAGSITPESGNFAIATDGETFYAYTDDDVTPTNGITDIFAVMYTGVAGAPGGTIPFIEDPSGAYLNALVVDGFSGTPPNRTEYDPTKRNVLVEAVDFENVSNWIHSAANQVLSVVPFADIELVASPELTTNTVVTFTTTTALLGGNITNAGSNPVTERGVVFSSADNTPTIGEMGVTKETNGAGTGSFSELIGSLTPNTTYYVQAYAINSAGTSYGGVESFTTNIDITITATAGANGSISPGGVIPVTSGDDQTFTITPDACYQVADVLVDGVSQGPLTTYTFTNVTASHTISATFSQLTYSIAAVTGAGGSISPSGATPVNCGDDQTFTITPDACYQVADVLVDGMSVGALNSYTFTNVIANHTISATFSQLTSTPIVTGPTTFCEGSSITLSTAPVDGASYCWQNTAVVPSWMNVGVAGFSAGAAETQSLAFSGTTPYVAYRDLANGSKTTVMKYNGANWENIGAAGFSGGDASFQSLAFSGTTPYVAYEDGANGNKTTVMKYNGTNWENVGAAGFSAGLAFYQSLAFSGTTPYVAYGDGANGNKTTVMKYNGTNWENVGAAGFSAGLAFYQSLAFSGTTPYVAYQDNANGYKTTVMKFNGTGWENVGTAGFSAGAGDSQSLAFSGTTPYVAYRDYANGEKTTVMKFNGTNWENVGAAGFSAGQAFDQSLVFSGTTPYVAYADGANGYKTAVMKFNGTGWENVGAAGFSAGGGDFQSLAFSGTTPYVAYRDAANDNKTTVMKLDPCLGNTNTLNVTAAGNYTVTVTNSSGCPATSTPVTVNTFSQPNYTITASAGPNGTITPNGPTIVNCGDDQTFTIAANAFYQIADVLVDGVSQGAVDTYTFTNVTEAHTILATFESLPEITLTAEASSAVVCGDNVSVTIKVKDFTDIGTLDFSVNWDAAKLELLSFAPLTIDGSDPLNGEPAAGQLTYTWFDAGMDYGSTLPDGTTILTLNFKVLAAPAAGLTVNITGIPTTIDASDLNFGPVTVTVENLAIFDVLELVTWYLDVDGDGYYLSSVLSCTSPGPDYKTTGISLGDCNDANVSVWQSASLYIDSDGDGYDAGQTVVCYGANIPAGYSITTFGTDCNDNEYNPTNSYSITTSAGAGGTITPGSTVSCGGNATVTVTPDACYRIVSVTVDGVLADLSGLNLDLPYDVTFNNVTENHTIEATFAINTYTITATAGTGGSISPSGVATVNCGNGTWTYTIIPEPCYIIADVLVDGASIGAVSSYTFTFVDENRTISALFSQRTYAITATAGSNGTITPGGVTTVNCGASQTYIITGNSGFAVQDVIVDGVSQGAVGTYTFTNVTAPHTISASFVVGAFTITAGAGANGTISPIGAVSVTNGGSQTFTITANPCYQIASVLVDGVNNPAAVSSGTYTFTNVTAPHTISAAFSQRTYTITASAGQNGTITPGGSTTVICGASQTFTIVADPCYQIASVLVDGVNNPAAVSSGTYTFTNVTAPHTISAAFSQRTYTITATAGQNGTITPGGSTTVNCGASQTFNITPNACFQVADVLVDGVSQGAVTTYTFTNVTMAHTISATFSLLTYDIAASPGPNGTIMPNGSTTVNCGTSRSFNITPDACYQIADVVVDGVSQGAITSYTFNNVTSTHIISASFSQLSYTIAASAGPNGSVTPNGVTSVNCGASQTYTIVPAGGFAVQNVIVDNVSQGAIATYTFTNVTAPHSISATFVASALCSATGNISYQVWNNIGSSYSIGSLTGNVNYPNNPSSSILITTMEAPPTSATAFGSRIAGYICAPATGSYTFWIASDNEGELWLSTNDQPANKVRIAYHNGNTLPREWNKYATQKSVAINLVQGQRYYIESLMKQVWGGSCQVVGWLKPGQSGSVPSEVIPGTVLSPLGPVQTILVSSVALPQTAGVNVGSSVLIPATVLPANASNPALSWMSGNPAIATVNGSGLVTGMAVGNVTITATSTDGSNKSGSCLVTVNAVPAVCSATGNISYQVWNNIGSSYSISSLTGNVNYPDNPSSSALITTMEAPPTSATAFGSRIAGYICAPATGSYTFWIASDNEGELWLSTNDQPANKVRIAYHNGNTLPREWNKYPSQKSAVINLVQDQRYYIESLMKQVWGGSCQVVGWLKPGQSGSVPSEVIPGTVLSPLGPVQTILVSSVALPPTAGVNVGSSVPIPATVLPANASNPALSWISSNPAIATVNGSGLVMGMAIGNVTITATSTDGSNKTGSCSVTVNAVPAVCSASGNISYQVWNNIGSSYSISSLTGNVNYPDNPSSSALITTMEAPPTSSTAFGSRIAGYICAPATGSYTFWIASDNEGELWLSTNDQPANKVRIAFHSGNTFPREWNKYATQKSVAINLVQGQKYYIESLMKQVWGGSCHVVGWLKPGQAGSVPSEVIPGSVLSPLAGTVLSPLASETKIAEANGETAEMPKLDVTLFVYPNPVTNNDEVTIKLDNLASEATLRIYTVSGVKCYEEIVLNSGIIRVDRSVFKSGMYIIKVENEEFVKTTKLIVN